MQLRLQKLQKGRTTLSSEAYAHELADIHQDLMNLGEWWIGLENEAFGNWKKSYLLPTTYYQ